MKTLKLACAAMLAASLAGCVVAPPVVRPIYRPAYGAPYVPPPGVVYVAPTYVLPAPGYVWQYHANYGWGWRHPDRGWHLGWR